MSLGAALLLFWWMCHPSPAHSEQVLHCPLCSQTREHVRPCCRVCVRACMCVGVCVITPTILASCPWNISFSCWLSLSPQPLLPLRAPQLLPCKLQACAMQGFVKLFSINWFFFHFFFFLSLGGSIAGCFRSRGSINCRPSIGRRRRTWNRNPASSSGSDSTWWPVSSRKPARGHEAGNDPILEVW